MDRHSGQSAARGWLACALLALALAPAAGQQPPTEPPLSAEPQALLKERDALFQEGGRLWEAGHHAEALAALDRVIALERRVWGEGHDKVIGSLEMLARLHEERGDFDKAGRAL